MCKNHTSVSVSRISPNDLGGANIQRDNKTMSKLPLIGTEVINLWKGLHALTFDLGKPLLHHITEPIVRNGLQAKIESLETDEL